MKYCLNLNSNNKKPTKTTRQSKPARAQRKKAKITSTAMLKKKYTNLKPGKPKNGAKAAKKPMFKTQPIKNPRPVDKKFKTKEQDTFSGIVRKKNFSKKEDKANNSIKLSKEDSLSSTLKSLNLKERLSKGQERKPRRKNLTSPTSVASSNRTSPKNVYRPQKFKNMKLSNISPKIFKKVNPDQMKDMRPIEIKDLVTPDSKANLVLARTKSTANKEVMLKHRKILHKMDRNLFREFKELKTHYGEYQRQCALFEMAEADWESRIAQKRQLGADTRETQKSITRLGKTLRFLSGINQIHESLVQKSDRTRLLNKTKHQVLAEKAKVAGRMRETRAKIGVLNSELEEYKKKVQRIFEEHSRIISDLLAGKSAFGISVNALSKPDKQSAAKKRYQSPKDKNKNNFYEDSFSASLSQEDNSFDLESGFRGFVAKRPREHGPSHLLDLCSDNIYSHKNSPELGTTKYSQDSSILQLIQADAYGSGKGTSSPTLQSLAEIDCLDAITVECLQSLIRSYKKHVQNLFDLYLFNEYTNERHQLLLGQVEKAHAKISGESRKLLSGPRREKVQKTLICTENHISQYKHEFLQVQSVLGELESSKLEMAGLVEQQVRLQTMVEEGEGEVKAIMTDQKKAKAHLEKLSQQLHSDQNQLRHICLENGRYLFKETAQTQRVQLDLRDPQSIREVLNDLSVNLETMQITFTAQKPRSLIGESSLASLSSQIEQKRGELSQQMQTLAQSLRRLNTQLTKQNHRISTLDIENYAEKFLKMADQRKMENFGFIGEIKSVAGRLAEGRGAAEMRKRLIDLLAKLEKRFADFLNSKLYRDELRLNQAHTETITEDLKLDLEFQTKSNIIDIIAQTSREVSNGFENKYEFSYSPSHENNDLNSQNFSSSFDPEKLKEFYKTNNVKTDEDFNYSFEQFGDKSLWNTNSGLKSSKREAAEQEWPLLEKQNLQKMLSDFDLEMDIEDILRLNPAFFAEINRLYFFQNFEDTNDLVIRDMINGLPVRANIKNGVITPHLGDQAAFCDYVGGRVGCNSRSFACAMTRRRSRSCFS